MRPEYNKTWLVLAFTLAGACLLIIFGMGGSARGASLEAARLQIASETPTLTLTPTVSPTPTATPTPTSTPRASIFMPWMSVVKTPPVELLNAWTSNAGGGKVQAFLPGAAMAYNVSGLNNLGATAQVGLRWDQSGACGPTQIFSDTLNVPAGAWTFTKPSSAPACTGVFTATASLTYEDLLLSRVSRFVVNQPGSIQISVQQGFDRCYAPDLDDMQTWWDESPYLIYNLYLGGVSFACKDAPLDAVWVHQAAEQGWYFILTWVGPQAPCTDFKYRMSSDPDKAYQQGRDEASSAHSAAVGLGFFGPKVIYYDIEAYTGASTSCRQAVSAFMEGWAAKLHELGDKAGGYGGACSSYMSDWASNDPPPDDVWIAHWIRKAYDPDVTVWDAPCVDNGLWVNHQRLKQYAGGHKETWGGVQLTIDSNVLDGEVNALQPSGVQAAGSVAQVEVETEGADLRDLGLVSPSQGWLLNDNSFLWTEDGGASWRQITPPGMHAAQILEALFLDTQQGWVVGQADGELVAARTQDGGATWSISSLTGLESGVLPQAAHLAAVDEQTVFAALVLPSSSSFSLGELFASADGGITWERRSLPLGEGVAFADALNGWTAGGASGNELYRTTDGGYTWQAVDMPLPLDERVELGMDFTGMERLSVGTIVYSAHSQSIWALVERGGCLGDKLEPGETVVCTQRRALLASDDGGESWREINTTSVQR
jgi:photosystem II stability/assembly factor-like uncharacterized protein